MAPERGCRGDTGEGVAGAPDFQAYPLSDVYPYGSAVADGSAKAVRYLLTPAREACTPFGLRGDTLTFYFPPGDKGVIYTRHQHGCFVPAGVFYFPCYATP